MVVMAIVGKCRNECDEVFHQQLLSVSYIHTSLVAEGVWFILSQFSGCHFVVCAVHTLCQFCFVVKNDVKYR